MIEIGAKIASARLRFNEPIRFVFMCLVEISFKLVKTLDEERGYIAPTKIRCTANIKQRARPHISTKILCGRNFSSMQCL